ncbi:kynurenine formamidase-like isoform X2 [Artemia franciscana]|uniref:kynurenine formamidase-like isoform X2 n=1 Tax=Artemia franciscana TaxID=6661 RepID=UPI0032DB6655
MGAGSSFGTMDPDHEYSPSRWSPRGTAEEIVAHHMKIVKEASEAAKKLNSCSLDVPYGKSDGERMDIYGLDLPKDAPVCVYIHGGYWQDLSKNISAYPVQPLYDAKCVTVILGYDLAPKVTVSQIIDQVKQGMVKVIEFATERGSRSVVVAGHSAGAHLASTLLSTEWISSIKESAKLLKALFLISGVFDLQPLIGTYVNAALSLDKIEAASVSPMLNLAENKGKIEVACQVVVGEYDPPSFKDQSEKFYKLLLEKGYAAELKIFNGYDHFNIVEDLRNFGYLLSQEIVKLAFS